MDEDARTVWCGNLSSRCTEEILYELFLQAGPVEKVHIPKDRDGKQKSFGFVTYRHAVSVAYALELFDGTTIYNRILTIKARQASNDQQQPQMQMQQKQNLPNMFDVSNQVLMGYGMPNFGFNMMPMYIPPQLVPYNMNGMLPHGKEERQHSNRNHPYNREHNNRDRRRDYDRDNRSDRGHRGHDHHKGSRNHRSNDHRSGRNHR